MNPLAPYKSLKNSVVGQFEKRAHLPVSASSDPALRDRGPLGRRHRGSDEFPRCADFMTMAEQELSAFFNAVTHLFGSEQAELSAEDWLRELIESDSLPASGREWRLITAKVSAHLARRVIASSLSTEFINA